MKYLNSPVVNYRTRGEEDLRKGNLRAFNKARKVWVQPLQVEPLQVRDAATVKAEDADIERRRLRFGLY
jgi:uncharacterized Fe-S cluster protein YjdI